MIYTESFKAKMVRPTAIGALRLAKEVGVSHSRWLRRGHTVSPMSKDRPSVRVVQTGSSARSAEDELRIVMAALRLLPDPWLAALAPDWLGAFSVARACTSRIQQRREAVTEGATSAIGKGAQWSSSRGVDARE